MATRIKGLQRQMRPSFERSDVALALKKAVPSMEGGFIVNTTFGNVSFGGADAEAIAGFVRALLEAKLVARRARSRRTGAGSMVENEEHRRNTERANGAAQEVGAARDPLATGT